MKLSNAELLEEFYKEIKDKHPDVSYEQVKEVCFGPWRYLKQIMQYGKLESVRFMYLGVFQVRPARAKYVFEMNKNNFKKGTISLEDYVRYQSQIEKFLNENKENK